MCSLDSLVWGDWILGDYKYKYMDVQVSGIRVCLKGICCGIRVRFNDVPVFHRRVEDEVVNIGIWKVGFVCGWRTTCVVLRRDSEKDQHHGAHDR